MIAGELARCPSGKDAFPDYDSAHRIADEYNKHHSDRMYTYECNECPGFHNTSQHQRLARIPKVVANRGVRDMALIAV